MATLDGVAAADRLIGFGTYRAGMCLEAVSKALGSFSLRSDRPGFYTYALRGWENTPADRKRYDRTPPKGAVVYFSASSNGYGHICLSLGGGRIASTDVPRNGVTGATTIDALERAWGRKFLGWAAWLMGHEVTVASGGGAASGEAFPARKLYGAGWTTLLQDLLGAFGHDTGGRDGKDGGKTQAAVRHEQAAARGNGYGTLTQDGTGGPATLTYLLWAFAKYRAKGDGTEGQPARARYGKTWVTFIQRLAAALGHDLGPDGVDGQDGPRTQEIVRFEQGKASENGFGKLTVDGIGGPSTAAYLVWAVAKYRLPWN